MSILKYVPSMVSILRLMALPFLILAYRYGLGIQGACIFIFAIATDLADGYLARRWHVMSKYGAHLDTAIDFIFISGMFMLFIAQGLYPSFLYAVIAFTYLQFIVTSSLTGIIYDPIGKYYGSLLYGAVGLTLLFQVQTIYNALVAGIVMATVASIVTRFALIISYQHRKNKPEPMPKP